MKTRTRSLAGIFVLVTVYLSLWGTVLAQIPPDAFPEPKLNIKLMQESAKILCGVTDEVSNRAQFRKLLTDRFKTGMSYSETAKLISENVPQYSPDKAIVATIAMTENLIAVKVKHEFSDATDRQLMVSFRFSAEEKLWDIGNTFTTLPRSEPGALAEPMNEPARQP